MNEMNDLIQTLNEVARELGWKPLGNRNSSVKPRYRSKPGFPRKAICDSCGFRIKNREHWLEHTKTCQKPV